MNELQELIEQFGDANEQVKALKKETDSWSTKIKEIMATSNTDSMESGKYVANYSVIKSDSFDEEKLIDKLKELGAFDAIKTKEYVDMDVLENAIYDGTIKGADLKDCKVCKQTAKLVVKVKKAKKEKK